jgi:hypothetical protein
LRPFNDIKGRDAMLGSAPVVILSKVALLVVYVAAFFFSLVYAFFIKQYLKFEEKFLEIDIFASRVVTPLDRSIPVLNDWCVKNHASIGMVMMMASAWVFTALCSAFGFIS